MIFHNVYEYTHIQPPKNPIFPEKYRLEEDEHCLFVNWPPFLTGQCVHFSGVTLGCNQAPNQQQISGDAITTFHEGCRIILGVAGG